MATSFLRCLGWISIFFFSSTFIFSRNPNSSITSKQYRTAYHFQPLKYWMNDPNGPMYYNGLYHLFYQHNANSALWGNISWGHSVSSDLIHWTGVGLALTPTEPFDINGCWSGSITILPGNKPVILYTGIDSNKEQVQNIVYPKNLSDPYLREWTKPDSNPVIKAGAGVNGSEFRDPTTAWVGPDGLWRVLVGNKIGVGGRAMLYKSSDFVSWVQAKEPLHSSDVTGVWECPDFFSYQNKYVLKVSLLDTFIDHYMLGAYDEEKDHFAPDEEFIEYENWARLDYGNFYASKSFYDENKDRRILWAWSKESDSESNAVEKGWAGIQTIPRVVWLDDDRKKLVQWPAKEIELLRTREVVLNDLELETGGLIEIKGLKASQADVEVEFEFEGADLEKAETFDRNWLMDPQKLCGEKDASFRGGIGPFGLLVLASHDREEHTAVFFRVFKDESRYRVLMCSDQRRSTLRTDLDKLVYGGFLDIDIEKDGKISLRTLIDHSVVESFGGGGRTCITARVYPTFLPRGDAYLYVFNNGSTNAKFSELKAWTMAKAQIS